ncbi:patatin-like phospholipase family protein [Tistrella sp.]|nr:patatin-like phospholipase family protein [Tistrella sp.]
MTRPAAPTRSDTRIETSAATQHPRSGDPARAPDAPPAPDPVPAPDPARPHRRRRRRGDAAARRGEGPAAAPRPPVLGVALGSGSARGWAHIGVLNALSAEGVVPQVIAGASAGAVVGAFHAAGRLAEFEAWVRDLTRLKVVRLGDFRMGSGGLVGGDRLTAMLREAFGETRIEDLPVAFGAIATDLASGQEVWLTDGDLVDALRASMSIPGIFAPVRAGGRLLVDGGLVNPVPVSLCRHLGAEAVIAVTLHGDLAGYRRRLRIDAAAIPAPGVASPQAADAVPRPVDPEPGPASRGHPAPHAHGLARSAQTAAAAGTADRRGARRLLGLGGRLMGLTGRSVDPERRAAAVAARVGGIGIGEVMMHSIGIMQDRIARSRMAGDPPDLVLAPWVGHIRWMEFDQGAQAIREGAASVVRARAALHDLHLVPEAPPAPGDLPG